jgi:hypothetical protein
MFLPCLPCCEEAACGVADGKPRTDPANEGHWVPTGTWATGVTWTFSSSPSTTDGGTWFFYGSASTSKVGGGATTAEQRDWGNICNWYSNKTTTPSSTSSLTTVLDKRATRLPPANAIVHVYSNVNTTTTGPVTVKNVYFWGGSFPAGRLGLVDASELTTTSGAHDSAGGCVLNLYSENAAGSTINGGATLNSFSRNTGSGSTINGAAVFNASATNVSGGIVNDGATFNDSSGNNATINDGATFNDSSVNAATVNDGATFNDSSQNFTFGTVNGGATFNGTSRNYGISTTVNGGATFNDSGQNYFYATVNDGAVFNDSSKNNDYGTVNGGATLNGSSENAVNGTVNGGATFNDAACSRRTVGSFANCPGPGERIFVAHPTDLPTCNGTAPDGCANAADTCGCG